jgi:putative component of toxin-antitoxin plasmid stabilization module
VPKVEVVYYQESPDEVAVLEWLEAIRKKQLRIYVKLRARIEWLADGHKMCRPVGDTLKDGICELRYDCNNGAYRLLYFFHNNRAVICHGVQKKGEKDLDRAIDKAIEKKSCYFQNPDKHTYAIELT